ncbi:nitroreductase family protein [Streptomyces tauricus]|uniref:hypothetical protein n=1 Tax=Streptomyces tauricus TaxID=68274 RepID=UPI002242F027|nr:hypothetical protein [Streptomyces tauricus]MCW8098957.1 hypothetical protein [Streptomyces tauricus]
MNRYKVLRILGATGLTWRAVDGGVFSTGTGSAYDAWHRAAPGGRPLNLVDAAILASNAHNTQPWLFTVSDNRIELFADMPRTTGALDPLLREMQISLGCAVENLALAAPPNGMAANVSFLPDPSDTTHIATVFLTPATASGSPLFDAIAVRHTNRGVYSTSRAVTDRQLDTLSALADVPGTRLVWFTTDAQKKAFGDLTVRATGPSSPTRGRPPTTTAGTAPASRAFSCYVMEPGSLVMERKMLLTLNQRAESMA